VPDYFIAKKLPNSHFCELAKINVHEITLSVSKIVLITVHRV